MNTRASKTDRAHSARQAVEFYTTKSKPLLARFSDEVAALDTKSLALVEAASAVRDEGQRKEAVQVASAARDAEQQFEAVTQKVSDLYSLQARLMTAIAENRGDLGPAFASMGTSTPQRADALNTEASELRNKAQSATRNVEERYAALKGLTGITLDYVETPAGNATQ